MLIKLLKFYNDDGKPVNIENDKIYWDTNQNVFRHRFKCKCGKDLNCRCFESLDSALDQVDNGMICDECVFEDIVNDLGISELIHNLDTPRANALYKHAMTLLTKEEIIDLICNDITTGLFNVELWEIIEILETDKRDCKLTEYFISLFTQEEKDEIVRDTWDEWATGDACEI